MFTKSSLTFSKTIASLAKATGLTGATVFAGLFLLYKFQNKIIYYPNIPNKLPSANEIGFRHPGEANLPYEDVHVTTPDGLKLHGWFIKAKDNENAPTIVVFQGRAGNIGHRVPFLAALNKYCEANLFIIGYRGYSYSEGIPTEKGIKIDSVAAMDYIFSRSDVDPNKIFVLGSSMGGAITIHALTEKTYPVAGVILENTFTSLSAMLDVKFPKFSIKVINYLLVNRWESIEHVHKIKSPMLFIMGLKDELIPTKQMEQLYKAATSAEWKEHIHIENGTHNETWSLGEEIYFKGLKGFMEKALAEKKN